MKKMNKIPWALQFALLTLGMSLGAAAQTGSQDQTQPPAGTGTGTPPAPAFGQNAPILNPENPPVSGLDEPTLELRTASRSFVSPALQVSESADTNAGNQLGGSSLESVTRVLGAFDLQQFWPKSDLFLEYLGGGAFYSSPYDAKQLQAVGVEAVTRWRTGQVTLRDSFSYLPDGSFSVGTFGGVPGFGLATGGGTSGLGTNLPGQNNFNSTQLGSVGNIPRLANTAILDAVQAINPVSAITVAGGFSNAHFYDSSSCAIPGDTCLINSDQITVEGGYTHLLNRHDQIGVVYAFQVFQFPQASGGEIYNHIVNIRWSHTITGRLSFIAGVGPQYTDLEDAGVYAHWSVSARVLLRYKFAHSSVAASYEKFTNAGSGYLAGANTQEARITYLRPLGRTWNLYADLLYSHNARLQTLNSSDTPGTTLGVPATSYDEGSASVIFRKHLGRTYEFFAAYRFSEVDFTTPGDVPFCVTGGGCGRIGNRNIGTVGIEWHPRPTRIE
jgi:hypothetical protein